MQAFIHLIAHTRKNLSSRYFNGLNSTETDLAIQDLEILDASNEHNSVTHDELVALYRKQAMLHSQNSSKWAQRAPLLWVQNGDHNIGFFIIQPVFVKITILFFTF